MLLSIMRFVPKICKRKKLLIGRISDNQQINPGGLYFCNITSIYILRAILISIYYNFQNRATQRAQFQNVFIGFVLSKLFYLYNWN